MSEQDVEYDGSTEDVIDILASRDRNEYPVMPTNEISKKLPVTKRTVINRLQGLEAADRVEALNLGNHKAWYLKTDQFLAGDEQVENIATDGAIVSDDLQKVDELLEVQNKMYEDFRRFRAHHSEQNRWAGFSIISVLVGFSLALVNQFVSGIPYIESISAFLVVVGLIAGVGWVYKRFVVKSEQEKFFESHE